MPEQPVGRELELAAIDRFLAARHALPAALTIEGPAGQGKTTVWRAGTSRARAMGYRVLDCRPSGAEVGLLFGGLSDLLGEHAEPALPYLPPPQRRALQVVLLLADAKTGSADQRAVAAGVLGVVRALLSEGPLLVAIDDVQWLDAASAMVLGYVARRLGDSPVAFLTARRVTAPDGVLSGTDAADALPAGRGLRLDRAFEQPAQRLALGPLSIGAVHRILRTQASRSFPKPLLRRIHGASGGNPLYALEIARAMPPDAAGRPVDEPIALGAGLQELLAGRFAALGRETRDALFVAAEASTPSPELIEGVTGHRADAALRAAVEAGIVRLTVASVQFVHPLLEAAARAALTPDERRTWHARMAEAEDDPEARARHLAIARPGLDAEVAELLHAAAEDARSRGAPAAAGELYAEAIGRLPAEATELRAAWIAEALPVLHEAGDPRLARALAQRGIEELAPGPARSDLLLGLSRIVGSDAGGDIRELALIERALEEAGPDARRRAAALLSRDMWERHQDRLAAALPFAREALTLAERAGDKRLRAAALTRTADLEVLLGLANDPVKHFSRALAAGSQQHLDAYSDAAPSMLAACLIRAGRVDEARDLLLPLREESRGLGDEASLEIISLLLTELEWLAGDWTAARAFAEEGLLVADQADSRVLQGALGAMLALVDASQARTDEARTHATAALATSQDVGDRSYALYAGQVLAFLELSLGDPVAALAQLEPLDEERGIEGTKRISFIGDRIEALVITGAVDEAARLTDVLERRGLQLHRPPLTIAAARCRAMVVGAGGDLDSAIGHAEDAVRVAVGMGLPFERARALLALGDVQRRAKRRAAARATLETAVAAFAELGAALWLARAHDSLARVGGRTRDEGLTPTESQVASLVARGLSNKEIAAELFVTVRAVEANLTRIYAKLGIRSRTELARRL